MSRTENLAGPTAESEGRTEAAAFLATLYGLVQDGQEDAAMQLVYSHLHTLRLEQRFRLCDDILEEVEGPRLPPVLLVALLTITAPLKNKLVNRVSFFDRAKQAIAEVRGSETTQRILIGLE